MKGRPAHPVRRVFRFCWRFARMLFVSLLLIVAALLIHLHNVGLPEFAKRMLVDQVAKRGWEMEYSQLRFRWAEGIVGEDLHFKPVGNRSGPQIFVEKVDFRLKRTDLLQLSLTPEALMLRNGRCLWILTSSNAPSQSLQFDHLQGILRYHEPDRLDLTALTARLHGLDLRIEGHMTNAARLRDLQWPHRAPGASSRGLSTEQVLHAVATQLDRCKLAPGASLLLSLQGDVLRTNSFLAELSFSLPRVESPWLNASNVTLFARVSPPNTPDLPFDLNWRLEGAGCSTPWGDTEDLQCAGQMRQRITDRILESGELLIHSTKPITPWARGDEIDLTVEFSRDTNGGTLFETHVNLATRGMVMPEFRSLSNSVDARMLLTLTNLVPVRGNVSVSTDHPEVDLGRAERVQFTAAFTNPETNAWWIRSMTTNGVGSLRWRQPWWSILSPLQTEIQIEATDLETEKLKSSTLQLSIAWHSPELEVKRLHAALNGGEVDLTASLNITNRHVVATVTNTSDAHLFARLLGTNTQAWLQQYGWKQPPWVRADAEITLPDWSHFLSRLTATNRALLSPIPWDQESLPSFQLHGKVKASEGDYRGVTFSAAEVTFHGSNQVWWLPEIVAHRPEGTVELSHYSDESTHDYSFHVRSQIFPEAIKPLFPSAAMEGFDLVKFQTPPLIEGDLSGRWRSPDRIGFDARVSVSNATFRGEMARLAQIDSIRFTNGLFVARGATLVRDEGSATVGQIWFDLTEKKVRLTNVISQVALDPVCRAIGPKVAEVMEDYQFSTPAHVRLNGIVDTLKLRAENDLHFDVEGGPFHWKLFNLKHVTSHIDWVKDDLDLVGLKAEFYEGGMIGDAHFDFSRDRGTDFQFNLNARGVFLSQLMNDLSTKSNRLEGVLDVDLVVTNANTRDKFTWNGYGRGVLTNGLIWDIPVFAVISPALNTFASGLGNSRARQAVGTFGISNGVIATQDLEIRANAMRLKATGSVDFDKRVSARMEAELLRDMPGLGFLISKVMWPVTKMFEFKITGTLDQPKTDQLYMVPRILLAPLHPIRAIKDLFQGDSKKSEEKPSQTPKR